MTGKYTLIYADPPWVYRDKAADGERGAGFKYPVMNVLDICRLPVWDLAAEDCLLAMWWVPTQPVEALKVVEAWGFRLMTMKGFTWHKTNKHKGNSAIGMGHMTRANSEDCLFAVRGKLPARMDASICQHVTAPRLENSRKPDVIREKLVQLLGDVPRIELSPASHHKVLTSGATQCEGPAVQLHPGYALDIAGMSQAYKDAQLHQQTTRAGSVQHEFCKYADKESVVLTCEREALSYQTCSNQSRSTCKNCEEIPI